MKKILIVIAVLGFFSSCYFDNASEMHPAAGLDQNCDTVNVTYSKNMVPLFSANCGTNNSCHSGSIAQGGVVLDNYSSASSQNDGKMLGSIEHQSGSSFMPPTGKLSDCGIRQIQIWIQNGKPQ